MLKQKRRRLLFDAIFGAALVGASASGVFHSSISSDVWAQERANNLTFSREMPPETNQLPTKLGDVDLLRTFQDPRGAVRTGAYWYWLSGNLSPEGAVKDVTAMKSVGIDRAYIGDIGVDNVPRGPVRTFSPEWQATVRAAFKTASELGVEMGIFNSPGWSQSGGPWVKHTQAMRYLVSSKTVVKGPTKFAQTLPKPEFRSEKKDEYQDVRVLAYPVPKGFDATLVGKPEKGFFELQANQPKTIEIKSEQPFTARAVRLDFKESPIAGKAELFAKIDGEAKKICEFKISRYNPEINVGFMPYAPITAAFEATQATEFQLVVTSDRNGAGIASVELSASPKVAAVYDKTLAKMHETPQPMWSEYQWAASPEIDDASLAVDPANVVDVTDKLNADGVLTWDVPEGDWIVERFGMTPTGTTNAPAVPEATGYEVDKMSKERVLEHFDAYMSKLIDDLGPEDGKSFSTIVLDSYEVGGQNFTDDFAAKFEKSFGYDPTPFLPVYFGTVVKDQETSDRFLWDLRRFVADEVAYSYVGGLRDASMAKGKKTWLECYGHWGFPGEFLQYGGQSNEIAGEYWSEGTLGDVENRLASSCGHIYGKTKIWAESNTCAGNPYGRSPVDMKKRADRFFSEGINNTLLHLYVMQPDERVPGFNAWFGNEFNRHNTWFKHLDVYVDYLKRCNFMLQQGLNVADVAYFIGEDAPKMMGEVDPALPAGRQFDFINAEVLRETTDVNENGELTLPHGTTYKVLVLPKLETMRPELLAKIKRLVADGAYVLGPKPLRSPSLQNQPQADADVKKMADELWGDVDGKSVKSRKFGKGTIAWGLTLDEVFAELKCAPDCEIPAGTPLVYCRRTAIDGDIYFLANQEDKELKDVEIAFRVSGKTPEIWYPATGETVAVEARETEDGRSTATLSFAPQESVFVVFRENKTQKDVGNVLKTKTIATLDGPWTVSFDSGEIARGPKDPVVFDKLTDWTRSDDPAIKFYSGSAVYKTTCELPKIVDGERVYLSLGAVAEMAKAKVNGEFVGGVWTAPYRLDVTEFAREGKNEIEIEVVNCWVNRLIGDAGLPEAERKTWCPVNSYDAKSPLKTSGLLGPVTISTTSR